MQVIFKGLNFSNPSNFQNTETEIVFIYKIKDFDIRFINELKCKCIINSIPFKVEDGFIYIYLNLDFIEYFNV